MPGHSCLHQSAMEWPRGSTLGAEGEVMGHMGLLGAQLSFLASSLALLQVSAPSGVGAALTVLSWVGCSEGGGGRLCHVHFWQQRILYFGSSHHHLTAPPIMG